ncbi:MAG: hypothetical protein V1891_04485 [bacterium]
MRRYLLYLDESGSGNLASDLQNLIITGVIVEDNADSEISGYFNYLKKIYKIPEGTSFHSYDLFENNKSEFFMSTQKAKKLVDSLIEFIKIIPIKLSIHYLDKKKLRNFLGMSDNKKEYFSGSEEAKRWKDIPYEILASKIFFWFSKYVNSVNRTARGAVVAESRRQADHALLRAYLRCKTSSQHNSMNLRKCSEKMQKQISSIRFEEKTGFWPGLEIADLFSYVAYQYVIGKIRSRKFTERNFTLLWRTIKNKIEAKKISEADGHTFNSYISSNRVNKISNKIKSVNKSSAKN